MPDIKSKITVKHYLNKRAKAKSLDGEKFYPLYLQLIVAGHKAQLKSKISEFAGTYKNCMENSFPEKEKLELILHGNMSDNILIEVKSGKTYPLHFLMNDEVLVITYIIRKLITSGHRKLTLANFSYIYDLHLKNIITILDDHIKKYYLKDLHKIFTKYNKKDDPGKLFRISDYFIHYIDWQKSFCSYYKTTCEVLPKEISLLENHLEDELKKNIKALLALDSRNSCLIKYLNKTEMGQFPCANYIDWIEKGKEFVTNEFIKAFGKQKALEYINSLDGILAKEVGYISPAHL